MAAKIPVPWLSMAGPIGFTLIEPVAQASDFLFDHWPGNDSLAWRDAMKCCAGDAAAEDAIVAFLTALEAAGHFCLGRLPYLHTESSNGDEAKLSIRAESTRQGQGGQERS
ncbi:MAG: DUF982 domain-containing protein [Mesorhizobium sp.]|nr:DUF982 domain-containing protein [Mesorhizobium sp. M1A.F.Ca.IN.022.04.1.1]RUV94941.1 DUF982 domain-containing protein [Mesorhizobium sp. M1A.F.Ca.IN.020.04.1.1]RUW05883.1 DUF982 domain-containing protein [Mesorhizobium sp. M1A.F.Ca.IN.020.03.1.1]RWF68126.1 MAG: DUF982 domain-containing protein [Mesorhizobium sp.]RWG09584.1 MAG: DUF982 domain-containing protein [Mesorhizobium sp.]